MSETLQEVENAIKILNLSKDEIEILSDVDGKKVFEDCLSYFVKSGDRRWWWENFRQESFFFEESDRAFELLNAILPNSNEMIWLIVEDNEAPFYPVYDAKAGIVKDIISECFAFEYYIINKDKKWLLCENHHNTLIGIGDILYLKNADRIMT